jgi:Cu(I)/Ag(I) efflux system membrane protein CusA/SilA
MLTLPFALIGGIWAMYFSGYNFSIAIAVYTLLEKSCSSAV